MKKHLFIVLAAALAFAAMFTGCNTTNFESQATGKALSIGTLPVKDFDVIGPISATATETVKTGMFNLSSTHTGSEMINTLLMNEVKKVGGHDAINVKISKKEESDVKFFGIFGKTVTYTYTATAIAIKYTDTVKGVDGSEALDTGKTPTTGYSAGGLGGGSNPLDMIKNLF